MATRAFDTSAVWISIVAMLPALLVIGVAAVLPKRLPPAGARLVAFFYCLVSIQEIMAAVAARQKGYPLDVQRTREFVSWTWAAANPIFAIDLWRSDGERFWKGLRLLLTFGNGLRLAAVVLLYAMNAPPRSFLPGHIDFESSVRFHIGCLVLSTFVLSPLNRDRISEWLGFTCVVLRLGTDVQLPEAELAAKPADAAERLSLCTESAASTALLGTFHLP